MGKKYPFKLLSIIRKKTAPLFSDREAVFIYCSIIHIVLFKKRPYFAAIIFKLLKCFTMKLELKATAQTTTENNVPTF
jgi:hypothetical protein